jgi:hypothetical protein
MKNIIIATTLLLFGGIMSSQTITNSKLTSECLESGYSSSVNCVGGWYASHGNPTIAGTAGENTWAWMWSHSNLGDGMVTDYNFQAGKTYQISFRIKTSSNISNPNKIVLNAMANVKAVSGMTATATNTIPKTAASGEMIWSKPVKSTFNNWTTISITFMPGNNNSQLWFYPLMTANANSNGGARIQMEIDDVVVTPLSKEAKPEIANAETPAVTPNPIKKGEFMRVTTHTKEIKEITIFDFNGSSKNITFSKIDNSTMEFLIDNSFKDGIYTLNFLNKDDTVFSKKIIVN